MASQPKSQAQVVVIPYMAQGHTMPLLDVSKALARRGLKVTFITTPSNAPFILSMITDYQPSISLSVIPFPKVPELPEGCENTNTVPSDDLIPVFLRATYELQQPFEEVLRSMVKDGNRPLCVISDFFIGWTYYSCCKFGIPRVVSHGMSLLSMLILKTATLHGSHIADPSKSDSDPIYLPGLKTPFQLNKSDFPEIVQIGDPNNLYLKLIAQAEEADHQSFAVLVNSFEELESDHISSLEELYINNARMWCVGPLLLYDEYDQLETEKEKQDKDKDKDKLPSPPYVRWLDKFLGNGDGCVIYVSFGSQSHLSDNQMDEIAFGLEMAGYPFVWVVRSKTWVPSDEWVEKVKGRGLVLRHWVDQRSILAHPAIGGVMCHSGWNTILESLPRGLPLLVWPIGSEQALNAKIVTVGKGAGITMFPKGRYWIDKIPFDRSIISDGVKKLMGDETGRKARVKARELGNKARRAVQKEGSSAEKLDQFIEFLITNNNK